MTRSFFVCATPRSGSSLLFEALEITMIAGRPREYFEPAYEKDWFARLGVSADTQYVEKFLAAGTTPNGVFGAKVHWHQFVHLRAKLRLIQGGVASDLELLRRTFPDLKYVFLTRWDKVLQAVSYVKALRTDVWHSLNLDAEGNRATPAQAQAPTPSFDVAEIDRWVTRFMEDETRWHRYFERAGIEPFEVVYEEFLETYESTVLAILRHLDIAIPEGMDIAPPRLRKLGDELSEVWARRYRELKWPPRPLRGTAKLSFFISTAPRTGGFLLAEALESTRIAGRPREYFDRVFQQKWCETLAVTSDAEYFEKALAAGTTPNGVFGAKVLWHQFEHLMFKLRLIQGNGLSDLELLRRTFSDLRYVFLTRRDKIRQAVSYDRAIRSGVWWSVSANAYSQTSTPPSAPAPPFAFEKIDDWVTRLTEFESNWRRHFKRIGVEPFEVAYEDLVENYESTVHAILRCLDLPISEARKVAPPRLRKQADEVTEEWVQRYQELKQ
ncbi:MAG: Stf0 family sulfotransferase [Isosphaeraceae bacterium]